MKKKLRMMQSETTDNISSNFLTSDKEYYEVKLSRRWKGKLKGITVEVFACATRVLTATAPCTCICTQSYTCVHAADRARVWHLRVNDCKHPRRLPK